MKGFLRLSLEKSCTYIFTKKIATKIAFYQAFLHLYLSKLVQILWLNWEQPLSWRKNIRPHSTSDWETKNSAKDIYRDAKKIQSNLFIYEEMRSQEAILPEKSLYIFPLLPFNLLNNFWVTIIEQFICVQRKYVSL